jgi:broad specificity phosphatase PhoE
MQVTARLTLICQAATSATRPAAFPRDEPIEASAREAATLATALRHADRAWTSPALAARQTAEALGLDATVAEALRDCDYGRWQGRRLAAVEAEEPEAAELWTSDPAATPHGGESLLALMRRAADWLESQAGNDGHTVAISHAPVIRALIVAAILAPPQSFWRIDVGPLARVALSRSGGQWRLRALGYGG